MTTLPLPTPNNAPSRSEDLRVEPVSPCSPEGYEPDAPDEGPELLDRSSGEAEKVVVDMTSDEAPASEGSRDSSSSKGSKGIQHQNLCQNREKGDIEQLDVVGEKLVTSPWSLSSLSTWETRHGPKPAKQVVLDPNNWKAGVTVALVSVPLSISLGIASGTTPMRGVSCAVFGGLCAGIFGSSDYNIVGPAGALSGMLMSYSIKWSDDVFPWLSLFSAIFVIICGALKLHTYMLFMPTSVFEGFTVGVALIIGLNQMNFAFGLAPAEKHELFILNIVESFKILGDFKWPSLIVFLVSTPLLYILMRKIPKIPWSVVLPLLSIPVGWLCDAGHVDVDLLTLKSKYGTLEPNMVAPLKPLAELVDSGEIGGLVIASISVSVVAILETLISAKIAGTRVDRDFNESGEMRGLAISHIVCGLTGSMPPTGVFVRTSLNTSLGATHRFAQVLNSTVVAIIAMALMPTFSYLPQPTIAAILVVSSIRMTPMTYLKRLARESKESLAVCLVTAAVCVGEDPVIGLGVGMVIALMRSAMHAMRAPSTDVFTEGSGSRCVVNGMLSYVNTKPFLDEARKLRGATSVTLDLSHLRSLDHDGLMAIDKAYKMWVTTDGPSDKEKTYVRVIGVGKAQLLQLRSCPWFVSLQEDGRALEQACG